MERKLFELGIKPAILMSIKNNHDVEYLSRINLNACHTRNWGVNGLIVSNTPIPKKLTQKELGELLGYYPPCCEEFFEESRQLIEEGKNLKDIRDVNCTFIDYAGMRFVTFHKSIEALQWCHDTYRQRILDEIGIFSWTVYMMSPKVKGQTQRRIILDTKVETQHILMR